MNKLPQLFLLTLLICLSSCGSTLQIAKNTKSRSNSSINSESRNRVIAHNRRKLADYAKVWHNTPYKYAGKEPSGFDCSGFTEYVFSNYGYNIGGTALTQAAKGRRRMMDEVKPGDLMFFGDNRKVSHVAIVSSNDGNNIFITHSTSSKGVITENLTASEYWSDRFLFAKDIINSNRKRTAAFR